MLIKLMEVSQKAELSKIEERRKKDEEALQELKFGMKEILAHVKRLEPYQRSLLTLLGLF